MKKYREPFLPPEFEKLLSLKRYDTWIDNPLTSTQSQQPEDSSLQAPIRSSLDGTSNPINDESRTQKINNDVISNISASFDHNTIDIQVPN